jgi:hypothetical protein
VSKARPHARSDDPSDVPTEPPSIEDVAIARKVLLTNAGLVAFVPVTADFDSWPVLVRLGRALHAVAGTGLGLVRAQALWSPERDRGQAPALDGSFEVREVPGSNGLHELVVQRATTLHDACTNLAQVAGKASGGFGRLLLDLSGFLPEVREVLQLPDAFVSAVVAGRTRERDLRALVELLPTSRHLGTLLID